MTNYEGEDIEIRETLPLLPVRDVVVYPFMILPLYVGRVASVKAVLEAFESGDKTILLAGQKDVSNETPSPLEIYEVGTVGMIMRLRKLPDGRIKILVQGLKKAQITNFTQLNPYYQVKIKILEEERVEENMPLVKLKVSYTKDLLEKYLTSNKNISSDLTSIAQKVSNPSRLVDLIASNLNFCLEDKQKILESLNALEKLNKISEILTREIEALNYHVNNSSFDEFNKNKKEFENPNYPQNFRPDFGNFNGQPDDEFSELRNKVFQARIPHESEKETLKHINRLEKMHPDSSEATILKNYLEWVVELPWSQSAKEVLDMAHSRRILDEDHYDLEKVKERILEFLAVKQLKGDHIKGPILCFSGPPGVGKTSLGKSIARATGRKFARISLGGIKDEAEIRGHRRTYVGAMPGRIIQALRQIQSNNPVLLLDEVDKLGGDFRGDPASALLEVLDCEQNETFRDNFINLPFDLSKIMFIATANVLENIPAPLKDRMEILHLSGYTEEEKVKISQNHLISKQLKENGIPKEYLSLPLETLRQIIRHYTSEAGLRNLERKIGALARKVAIKLANGLEKEETIISPEMLSKFLGPKKYEDEGKNEQDEVGVATGLAWTPHGGQIFSVESTRMKGKGITLTGQLGDVMKESAQTAIGFIRANAESLLIDEDDFENFEIHIHLPAGAIPKDGPSAGITLATTIVSLFTNCPVDKELAMTGEITLTGKVLPIGGLKEKALAAMRMGIHTIIIPEKNLKDLVDIPKEYLDKIKFIPIKRFPEVLEIALKNWKIRKKNWKKKRLPLKKTPESRAA